MKKRYIPFFFLFFIFCSASAQMSWKERAGFPGAGRHRPFSFAIGQRGYIGAGHTDAQMYSDFWEYDPATDSWTQKADYAAGINADCFGFAVGNKGYAGMGWYGSGDIWEYNPVNNTWTMKAY